VWEHVTVQLEVRPCSSYQVITRTLSAWSEDKMSSHIQGSNLTFLDAIMGVLVPPQVNVLLLQCGDGVL